MLSGSGDGSIIEALNNSYLEGEKSRLRRMLRLVKSSSHSCQGYGRSFLWLDHVHVLSVIRHDSGVASVCVLILCSHRVALSDVDAL